MHRLVSLTIVLSLTVAACGENGEPKVETPHCGRIEPGRGCIRVVFPLMDAKGYGKGRKFRARLLQDSKVVEVDGNPFDVEMERGDGIYTDFPTGTYTLESYFTVPEKTRRLGTCSAEFELGEETHVLTVRHTDNGSCWIQDATRSIIQS